MPGWPEGATLGDVRFMGALPVREAELARALALPGGRAPDSTAVERGVTRLVEAFHREGWLDARVDSLVPGAVVKGKADLVVYLSSGARHALDKVTFEGLVRIPEEEARTLTGLVPGAPFRAERIDQGLARLVAAYEARGFPAARATVLDFTRTGAAVDLFVRVFEGDSTIVRALEFENAHLTRRSVMEKSMGNVVGVPYNRARLAQARQRLMDLGVFTFVGEPRVEPMGEGGARVVVPVEEARANTFDGAVGYQGDTKTLTGLANVRLDNLGGSARQGELFWEGRGRGRSEFRVRYVEPLLFGLNLKGEVLLSQFNEDTTYARTRIAGRFTFGIGGGGRLFLTAARDRTVLETGPVEHATATTTEAGFELDRRDNPFVPRRGRRSGCRAARSSRPRRCAPTARARTRRRSSWPMPSARRTARPGGSAGARGELEGGLRLSNEPVVPVYDLDFVGGATTLRGYREGEFQVARWAVVRLEYGVFTAETGRVFAFLDQGVLDRPFLDEAGEAQNTTLYRAGYGIGIEAPLTLGRLGLTLGYGKGDGPLDGKLHVRLTSRF
jgi:outer membrane protein assembly factor BamA